MHRKAVIAAIGTGQLLAWGATFYLPAVLAEPMAHDTGVEVPTVFMAFSVAMGGSALIGPWAGRTIDRFGGRPVLIATNLIFAAGLAALASASGPVSLFVAWGVIGLAMGAGLYEAAFATVVRLYGSAARDAITGITLLGGFASTVGWPLSACFVFAATWFITTAIAAHGPRVLQAAGTGAAAALAVGALIGPAQVLARLVQFGPLRHADPLRVARLASLGHPVGVLALLVAGPALAPAFAMLHGAGGGLMTIARGALPLVYFGPVGYGARQGLLMLPTRIAQALSPYLSGLALERWGADALWGSAALGLAAWFALRALRAPTPRA